MGKWNGRGMGEGINQSDSSRFIPVKQELSQLELKKKLKDPSQTTRQPLDDRNLLSF